MPLSKLKHYLKQCTPIVYLVRLARHKFGLNLLPFFFLQRVKGFTASTTPCFDSESSTLWFIESLKKATYYLEYGSGGSTYLAAQLGKIFQSIDTDPYYLEQVRKKIEEDGFYDKNKQKYIHADIGLTREWGHPVMLTGPNSKQLKKFENASTFPPNPFNPKLQPDLILIDGRFRVACALKAIQALQGNFSWTLIMDDYANRPYYHVVEKFAKLEQMVGRMAIFTHKSDLDEEALDKAIIEHEHDPN